jgi:hypothetical protein
VHAVWAAEPASTAAGEKRERMSADCVSGLGDRSKRGSRGAFPRQDKMMDHLSRKHADKVGGKN